MEIMIRRPTNMQTVPAGRPPEVTDDEILDVFEEATEPVLIASEVAESLPIGRRGVYKRLEQLEDDGKLGRKKIGGRGTVWWLADRECSDG